MPAAESPRHAVLARLRDEIRRLERRPARAGGVVPCGRREIDALLPGGGFPRGAIAELAGGPASGKTRVALSLFAALGEHDLSAFVDGRGELYPPAAEALGVDLGRLLIVRPGARPAGRGPRHPFDGGRVALWAAEALLASGAFAAVAVDVPLAGAGTRSGAEAAVRRLQAAAERGGTIGLWLSGEAGGVRVPAAVRLALETGRGGVRARRTVGGVPVPASAGGGSHAA
jgi:protein ImuA